MRSRKIKESHYRVTIKSDPNEIQNVEKFTEKLTAKLKFSDQDKDSLAISITEIVNNAIMHGNKSDKNKKVVIDYICSSNDITITVQDEGAGFNEDQLDDPVAPENLLKESGRGIYIVRTLMDEVKYEFNKKGTLVRIKKFLKIAC